MEGGRGARTWATILVLVALLVLPAANAAPPRPAAPPWMLRISMRCTQPNVTAPAAMADIVFVNDTDIEGFDNYTLTTGQTYAYHDFASVGLNLTNVSEVVIMAHPPTSCPTAGTQEADINVSQGGTYPVNITFSPVNTSGVVVLPLPPTTSGPVLPLFIQLAGVGVVAMAFWFFVLSFRKTTEVLQ